MTYDAPDSTPGRALATFDGAEPGAYTVVISGVDTGRLPIGDSVARRALPGVLAGLAITGLSFVAASVVWLTTFIKRSARREQPTSSLSVPRRRVPCDHVGSTSTPASSVLSTAALS